MPNHNPIKEIIEQYALGDFDIYLTLTSIAAEIEKMKKKETDVLGQTIESNEGYNQAIDEVVNKIKGE